MPLRRIWRSLPVHLRRPLANVLTTFAAPGLPEAGEARLKDAPIIVVGFLSSASGLGQAARLAYRSLEAQGFDVRGVDLSGYFYEAVVAPFAFRDARAHRGPARVLININAPYMAYAFNLLGRAFLKNKYVVGYWAWELPHAPERWRDGFARVHALAAPSQFVANAIAKLGKAPPIKVAPHPVLAEPLPSLPPRAAPISADAPFTIAFAFSAASGFERKNPLALIAAFRRAFPHEQDVRLRMLATNLEHYPAAGALLEAACAEDRRIEVTSETLDRAGYWLWYGRPDLYASLHRAEGFGLPLAESMALGVPVMATDWSGNTDFMHAGNAIPIAYRLTPLQDAQQKYTQQNESWAEADTEHAAAQMQRAKEDTAWLARIAAAGQAEAKRLFSTFQPF